MNLLYMPPYVDMTFFVIVALIAGGMRLLPHGRLATTRELKVPTKPSKHPTLSRGELLLEDSWTLSEGWSESGVRRMIL